MIVYHAPPWALVVLGIVMILIGVLSIVFRRNLRRLSASGQRSMLGDRAGGNAERTPLWAMILAGIVIAGVGLAFLLVGLEGL